jgi:hypothetical protein
MVIPPADQKFEAALKVFEGLVGDATQFWFVASGMNEVAKQNPATVEAFNRTPSFWITVRVALEYQGILSVAKLFGPRRSNPYNIDYFFQVLRESCEPVFSADALRARKRRLSSNADTWLEQFMARTHVLTIADINALHVLSKPHRRTYESQWEQVRNEHIAHLGIIDANARWEMFQHTNIPALERLIVFLNDLLALLWNVYYNGARPVLKTSGHSVQSLVAANMKDLGRSRNEEHIVRETRLCLESLSQTAPT